jgi:hypothetical protein
VNRYKVVFTSIDIPEHTRQRVKSNLSVVFKQPISKLEPLFCDRPVTIKKDLDLVEANRYRDVIEREGGVCRVESMNEGTESMSMQISTQPRDETVTCPRCMTRQKKAPICAGCGVILKGYEEEIRAVKAKEAWVAGRDRDRRVNTDRRLADDRRGDIRFQDDRRVGNERRAAIAGWHRNSEISRG